MVIMAKSSVVLRILRDSKIIVASQKVYFNRQQRWQTTASTNTSNLKTLKDMPGLSTLPIIGSLHHFIPGIGKVAKKSYSFFELLKFLGEEYGLIVKFNVFARGSMVILYDPHDYEKIFRAEDVTPSRPGFDTFVYYRTVMRKSVFDGVYGLTTAEGAQWRDFRTKVNPALLMPKLIKLYTPAISEVADDMVERLKKFKDDNEFIDNNFHFEMTKYALESLGVVGLGARLGCFEENLPPDHPAAQLIKAALDVLELSFKLEFSPSPWKWISTPNFKALVKTFDLQWSISETYIQQAKKTIKERGHDIPEEDKSVIERLLAVDERVAIMMANEMLLAGIETVAFTLMNILYHLATYPETQNKLREEIRFGDGKKSYLRACIKEALRIYPVIPGNLRRTTKEHVVGGYLIPKGVDIISPNEVLSKSEKYYPRPYEFIPERWIVDKTDPLYYGNAPPMVTQPFGFGVRTCIGRRIAELEIESLTSKVIDQFEVTWDGAPVKVITRVSNTFQKPYSYRFKSLK